MMRMLEAGGLPLFVDGLRAADEFNPNGYFEYEGVKKLKEGETAWLAQAQGRVVKVVSPLLPYLPAQYLYNVIFMKRDLKEIIRSQAVMLNGFNKPSTAEEDALLEEAYRQHLASTAAWLKRQTNLNVMYVEYHQLLFNPEPVIAELAKFIGKPLQTEAMKQVIDLNLYRNRNGQASVSNEENK